MSTLSVGSINTTGGVKLPSVSSSNRPGSPSVGQMIWNSTTNIVEFWDGSIWSNFESGALQASGGTVTNVGGYRIHTFTGDGTFTVTNASDNAQVEYLIVAGGGGGGAQNAGGGGGGGLVYGSVVVSAQAYPIVVGGGAGAGPRNPHSNPLSGIRYSRYPQGIRGNNSSAFGYTAIGGGNGAGDDYYGCDGGSGGGGDAATPWGGRAVYGTGGGAGHTASSHPSGSPSPDHGGPGIVIVKYSTV